MAKVTGNDGKTTLYCSFCGKNQHEVRKLIAGRAHITDYVRATIVRHGAAARPRSDSKPVVTALPPHSEKLVMASSAQ